VNSRLLIRLQKKHGSQRCRVELVELTVDDVWQIADAGDQELQRLARIVHTSHDFHDLARFRRATVRGEA